MVIRDDGYSVTLPPRLKHFNERDQRWLWANLREWCPNASLNQFDEIPEYKREELLNHYIQTYLQNEIRLIHEQSAVDFILLKHKRFVVPEEQIKWINRQDTRLLLWLEHQIHPALQLSITENVRNEVPLDLYARVILKIDLYMSPTIHEKVNWVNHLKKNWSEILDNTKHTNWIKENDSTQLEWAWLYLKRHNLALLNIHPTDNKTRYTYILASIDNAFFLNPAEKELFISRMKKSWSQQKYRSSDNARKPLSFGINQTTKNKLDELVEHDRQHLNDVMARLIHEEHKRLFG